MSEVSFLEILLAIVAIAGLLGGFIIRDRQIFKSINDGLEKVNQRINNVQNNYVRRDDLDGLTTSIENTINQMREEQRETNRRIDMLLTEISKTNCDK